MMLYRVTSLAFDADARKAYYTEDNYAFRDLMEVDVDTGKKTDADPRRADRRPRRQPRRQVDLGDPPPERLCDDRPDSASLMPASTRSTRSNMGAPRSTSTFRRTARWLSASMGEIDGKQTMRVWRAEDLQGGAGPQDVANARARAVDAGGVHLHARRQGAARKRILYRASRTSSGSTSRPRNIDVVSNSSTGLFRPMQQPDGSLIAYEYTGAGPDPGPAACRRCAKTSAPSTSSATGWSPPTRAQELGRRLAGQSAARPAGHRARQICRRASG